MYPLEVTAAELLRDQLDDAGFQISRVLEGMPEAGLDYKLTPTSMTPREQIAHLCEAYEAFKGHMAGRKYEWGSYQADTTGVSSLLSEFRRQRLAATEAVLASPTDTAIQEAHLYILAHDYYHVGQMCLARLAVDPAWDPYAIYRS